MLDLAQRLRSRHPKPAALSPDEAKALFDRVGALMEEKRPLEALSAMNRLILLSEAPPSFFLLRASIRAALGDPFEYFDLKSGLRSELARPEQKERLRKLEPMGSLLVGGVEAWRAASYFNVGVEALEAGRASEAIAHLAEAMAIRPNAKIYFHCGRAALLTLDLESAAECFNALDDCDGLEELYEEVPPERVDEIRLLASARPAQPAREGAAKILFIVLFVLFAVAAWRFLR